MEQIWVWKGKLNRLARAQKELNEIIRRVSEREGIDFSAFPFSLSVDNYLTDEERQRIQELQQIIREEIERRCGE